MMDPGDLLIRQWLDGLTPETQPWPGDLPPEPEMPEYFRTLGKCTPPHIARITRLPLADARKQLTGALAEYVARPLPTPPDRLPIKLVAATPGLGKTTAAVRFCEQQAQAGQHILYAGPRHDFYVDLMRIADHPELWYEWLPRQVGDERHVETCPYATEIGLWMARGYRAMAFCKGVCGWDYINDTCAYHAQKSRPEPIIFGMHEHVVYGHPRQFHVVVGDESPIDKFCNPWTIPPRFVFPFNMPESGFRDVVLRLATLIQSGMKLWDKPLYDALGGAADVLAACDSFTMTADIIEPDIHQPEDAANADYGHLPHLALALRREAKRLVEGAPIIPRVEIGANGLTLYRRHQANPKLPEHVIWLDATANRRLYEQVFRRETELLIPQPQMAGRFYQLYQRAYNKGSVWSKKADAARDKSVGEALASIKHIAHVRGYKQIGVISFKALTEAIIKALPGAKVGHFYAARGTNEFEDCDGLFVLGTPQPDQEALPKIGRMIYLERDEPFNPAWSERRLPYNYADAEGMGRDYPVSGYWADRDLHEILAATRDEEILQAAHRARPLHRRVDVWLMNNVPHPSLVLDGLLTYAEALEAPVLQDKDMEAPGYNVFQWPRIVEVAEAAYVAKGYVAAEDLEQALAVTKPTALTYLRIVAAQPGWEMIKAARKVSAGRTPLAAARTKEA